jgi:hypothetical protein
MRLWNPTAVAVRILELLMAMVIVVLPQTQALGEVVIPYYDLLARMNHMKNTLMVSRNFGVEKLVVGAGPITSQANILVAQPQHILQIVAALIQKLMLHPLRELKSLNQSPHLVPLLKPPVA